MQDKQTAVINTAVIVIGSYHLPASVAIGALVGASLFILGRQGYPLISKAWLFAVSYFFGIFAGDDAADLLTIILPFNFQANDFTGSVLAAAFSVFIIQRGYAWLATRLPSEPKKE